MAAYVDGFVIPIKKKNVPAYKKMATKTAKLWMEHGALAYSECVGDDLVNKWGTPFLKLCKIKADETVVFAFVTFKSKTERNKVNAKVMKDPRMIEWSKTEMPFDMKRFTSGGFKTIVVGK